MPTVDELGRRVKAKHPGQYDDLDDADVGRRVKTKFPGAYDDFEDAPAPRGGTGVLSGLNRALNPLPAIGAVADVYGEASKEVSPGSWFPEIEAGARTVGKIGAGLLGAHGREFKRAGEEFKRGDYGQAAASAVLGAVPLAGPWLSDMGERAIQGDVSGAITEGVSGVFGPGLIGRGVRALGKAPLGGTKAGAAVAENLAKTKAIDEAMVKSGTAPARSTWSEVTPVAAQPIPTAPLVPKAVPRVPQPVSSPSEPGFTPPPQLPYKVNETAFRRDVAEGARQAMNEAAALIPAATSPEAAGAGVQSMLKQGSALWHRRGGELYEEANQLLRGVPVPTKPVRGAADKILLEAQSARELFPESSLFPPDVLKALNEISGLPDTAPYEALDAYRRILITKLPAATEIAASQKEGIIKSLTKGLTESMIEGAEQAGGDAARASAAARAFWREGAELFDNSILRKAMESAPEDVLSLIKPEGSMRAPSIAEARRLREGVLDYAQKYGTDAEKAAARTAYNNFLEVVADKGLRTDDLMKLPDNYASFGEVTDILFNATPEGKVMLKNLDRVVDAVGNLRTRVAGIPKPEITKPSKVAQADVRRLGKTEKRLGAERRATADEAARIEAEAAASQKLEAEAARQHRTKAIEGEIAGEDRAASQAMAKLHQYQERIANALGTAAAMGTFGKFGIGIGSAAGATGGFYGVRQGFIQILKSPRATAYLVQGLNTAPAAEMLNQPTSGMWLSNIRQAAEIAQGKEPKRSAVQPFTPEMARGEVERLRATHGTNWDASLAEVNRHYRDNPRLWKEVRQGIVNQRRLSKPAAPTHPKKNGIDPVGPLAGGLLRILRESGNGPALLDSWRKLKLIPNDILDALEREAG